MSTRRGGVSPEPYGMNMSYNVGDDAGNVSQNRKTFLAAFGVVEDRLAIPEQRHTGIVQTANAPGRYAHCDALITNTPGVYLSVSVADCVPVFLFDAKKNAVACVHAGWRGTGQRISEKAVARMQETFDSDPADIIAYVGPSAGACCYQVGSDVSGNFDGRSVISRNGATYLDVKVANEGQLRNAGILEKNIEVSLDCTICNPRIYHSYRRDRDKSGRMLAIIGLRH